jgi:hypothetical protein
MVIVRYILATLLAVAGGYVGYYFVPLEPFGAVGNTLFVSALFGMLFGMLRLTGFFGNVVNVLILSPPLYFTSPGEWFVIWVCGNTGYAVGNVMGQLARLSVANEIEVKAL